MSKSILPSITLILTLALNLPAAESVTLTTAESSNYTSTSLYKDVIRFIFTMQKKSNRIKISKLATSTEGRMIPLVIISEEGIKSPQQARLLHKPTVLINANIHAGEVEGKEAALMLIRDFANHKIDELLKNQVVLVIPIFNADGNDKLGRNRRDNGPELAGTRYNGQKLDLNRDFLKLESPEVRGLVKAFHQWEPVLFVDMHTTNGSYHQEPVTYTTHVNPNTAQPLRDYMWNKLFPQVSKTLKKQYGYDGLPYGNFTDRLDPAKGWENDAFEARYSNNYAGLRNMFAILNENYSHADFKTRVLASLGLIKAILQYTHQHIQEMQKIVQEVNLQTSQHYHQEKFVLDFKNEKLFDLTVKSYEFTKEKIKPEDRYKYPPWFGEYLVKKTDVLKDYHLSYFSQPVPSRQIGIPDAYIITPFHHQVVLNLRNHGIVAEKIRQEFKAEMEKFVIQEIKLGERLYQGHVLLTLKGHYETEEITVPKDAYFVSMNQPLARLAAILLEPESTDSLAAWGFFNRELVAQWTNQPESYPIYRLLRSDISIELYQD